jgi:hypothetical protein
MSGVGVGVGNVQRYAGSKEVGMLIILNHSTSHIHLYRSLLYAYTSLVYSPQEALQKVVGMLTSLNYLSSDTHMCNSYTLLFLLTTGGIAEGGGHADQPQPPQLSALLRSVPGPPAAGDGVLLLMPTALALSFATAFVCPPCRRRCRMKSAC